MEKGALKQKILWTVQKRGLLSASEVAEILREDREISLNAVQTVLNRLVEQGLLIRTGTRRRYLYQAQWSEEVVKQTATHAAMDLLSQSEDLGLAYFVETMDQVRPEAIEKLERLLQSRKSQRKQS